MDKNICFSVHKRGLQEVTMPTLYFGLAILWPKSHKTQDDINMQTFFLPFIAHIELYVILKNHEQMTCYF